MNKLINRKETPYEDNTKSKKNRGPSVYALFNQLWSFEVFFSSLEFLF